MRTRAASCLADYLRARWLPHQATRVRPRTLLRYRQLLETHVTPRIGRVRLRQLRPAHVQDVLDTALAAGRAPRTVAGVYRTLHAALSQAVRWQVLAVNPATAVSPPRADRRELTVPGPEVVGKILRAAAGTRWHVPLVLAASAGLRRGEVMALRWEHVDLVAAVLRVASSFQRVDGEIVALSPKTSRGRRQVALPPGTVAILRQHRKDQPERRLLLGEAWQDHDLVVDQGDGGPVSPDGLSRSFYRLTRALGYPGLRLHDLRHAYASALVAGGVHPKIASEALGHASVGFTLDTYSHLLPGMGDAAAQAIQEALGEALQ